MRTTILACLFILILILPACQSDQKAEKKRPDAVVMVGGQSQTVTLPDYEDQDPRAQQRTTVNNRDEYLEPTPQRTFVRTYDLRPFMRAVPYFYPVVALKNEIENPKASADIFGGTSGSDVDILTGRELTDRSLDLVRTLIDPEGWRLSGGLTSSMSELDGMMVISTTEANHRQIAALLDAIADQGKSMIALELVAAVVPSEQIEKWKENILDETMRVSPEHAVALRKQLLSHEKIEILAVVRQLAMNGQKTAVNLIKSRRYADDISVPSFIRDEEAKAFRQVKGLAEGRIVQLGIVGSLDPLITHDRDYSRTTLKIDFAEADTIAKLRGSDQGLRIIDEQLVHPDLPESDFIRFGTTVRLKSGSAVLLTQSGPVGERIGLKKDHELVLFFRPVIVID